MRVIGVAESMWCRVAVSEYLFLEQMVEPCGGRIEDGLGI